MSRRKQKPYVLKVSREIWESEDATAINDFLIVTLMADQAALRHHRHALELTWAELPQDGRPPWAVPAVANTIRELDRQWPLALYFFDRRGRTLEDFQLSIGEARVVRGGDGATLVHDQARVSEHFARVWVPAHAKVCSMAGYGQAEFDDGRTSALEYFKAGPRL